MLRSRAVGVAALSLLAAGLVALPAATASADPSTLYVDIKNAACSDTGGGTAAQPYCTLQAATDAAQPGDTVHVADNGTYPATTVTTSGSPDAPITLTGQNYFSLAGLTFSGVHDVSLRQVQTVFSAGGIRVTDSSHVTLDQLHVDVPNGDTSVEISGSSSDVTVSRSYLEANDASVVKIDAGVQRTVVTTNDISGVGGVGVDVEAAADTDVTSNSTAVDNNSVSVSAGSTGTIVENNVVSSTVEVSADSASQTTAAYNLFYYPRWGGALYDWAGTAYTDVASFQTATGQGRMDILDGGNSFPYLIPEFVEGFPGIDSADADAPGELPTDLDGWERVDDPLVDNTGTGSGYVDRGAHEFEDPYHPYGPSATPEETAVGSPVTITTGDVNPWHDAVQRTYDFGDGTPVVTSTADSVQHTYTTLTGGQSTRYTITVTEGSGSYRTWVQVSPPGPLTGRVRADQETADSPLSVTIYDTSTSPFTITSCKVSFGDGTPATSYASVCGGEHTYARPGTYTITTTDTDWAGRSASVTTKVVVSPVFVPVGPTRILDTRTGQGAPKAHVGPGGVVHLKVNGAGGVANATSVLLNVTATSSTTSGYVTAYPDGAKRPTASTLNYRKGQTVANLVTVPVASNGTVDLFNSAGSVDLVADVEGYATAAEGTDNGTVLTNDASVWGEFRPVLDTRGSSAYLLPRLGKVGAGKSVTFQALLPDTHNLNSFEYPATAVVLSVTETHATASSYVTAYRPGTAVPNASGLNFSAGETRSSMVVVPVDSQGRVSLYNHAGSVDLVASVEGFYLPFVTESGVNKPMNAVTPARVLDTRSGVGGRKAPVGPTSDLRFKVAGVAGIPAGATGVMVNLTAVAPTSNGYLVAWGDLTGQATASALNFMRGQITPVLVYLPIAHGYATVYNPYGSVDVVADVEAYSVT
jgi:PKD repeat protein